MDSHRTAAPAGSPGPGNPCPQPLDLDALSADSVDMSTMSCPWGTSRFAADLPIEDYPSSMITRLAQSIQAEISSTYAREQGLSVAEWRVLARLNSRGATPLADLCRGLAMDKAYVSRLLRSLQPQGLIAVETSPDHGRRLIVDITAKGRAVVRRILPKARESQEQLLRALEPDERSAFYTALQKLQAAVDSGKPRP